MFSNIFRNSIISFYNKNKNNIKYLRPKKKEINIPKHKNYKKRSKREQRRFREKLIERYYKCPIDNLDYTLCEACHIIPYSESKENQKFDVFNGILLTPTLHRIYDKNYFKIDENSCRVEIIEENIINDNISICDIKRLVKNGKYIPELDNPKSKEYLKIRNENI